MRTTVTLGAIVGVMFLTTAAAEAITYDGRITTAEWGAYFLERVGVVGDATCPYGEWDVYGYYDDDYVYMGVELSPNHHPLSSMYSIGQMVPGVMGFTTPNGDDVMCSLSWLPPTTWTPGGAWDWVWWAGVWVNPDPNDAPARYHPFWNMGWDGVNLEHSSLEYFGGDYGYYTGYEVTFSRAHGGPLPADCTGRARIPSQPIGYSDADGRVSFCDVQKFELNFGKIGATYRDGDFTGDGRVSFADYKFLEMYFHETLAFEIKIPWSLIEFHTGEQPKGDPLDWYVNLWMGTWWLYPDGTNSSSATGMPYIGAGSAAPEPATIALLALGVGGLVAMRKRKRLLMLLAVVLVCGLAATSNAADATLTVEASGGQWWAYAEVTGGSCGISSFQIDVKAGDGGAHPAGDLAVTGSTNKSPKGYDPDWNQGEGAGFGFTQFRSNGDVGMDIYAMQFSLYGDTNGPLLDDLVLQGIGISSGSRCGVTWNAKVLLAEGTYGGTVGWLCVDVSEKGLINLLKDMGASWEGPGNVESASTVIPGYVYVPEPATIAFLTLGVSGLLSMERRKQLLILIVAALIGGLAVSANAATATLSLTADATKVYVWAQVNGTGVEGISSFGIDITSDAGVNLGTSTNKSPKGYDPDWNEGEGAEFGFKMFRSNGVNGIGICAGQGTMYGNTNDPLNDDLVLQGVGQVAGSRCGVSWAYPVLLAQCNYTVTTPGYIYVNLGPDLVINLLETVGSWYGPGNVEAATYVYGDQIWVPEPATAGLMALGLAGLFAARRRQKRQK